MLLCALLALALAPQPSAGDMVTVKVDRSHVIGTSRFETGVTHAQYSLDDFGDQDAVERGKRLLQAACRYQNQHIMGWGAGNPEPSPGVYDWESLDRRMELIRSMGATPVITLCAAPDWMKGGEAGKTDWSKIEVAPAPEHYADFAELARQVAKRYPDVKRYQVWNEFKGFWDAGANNWDYRGYTKLYNLVYDALKSVSRDIQVGGPYLVIEGTGSGRDGWAAEKPIRARQWEIIDYWLKNKHGADYITLDRGLVDFHDGAKYTPEECMALTHTFGDIARQVHAKTHLPIWWAEYYGAGSTARDYAAAQYTAIMAEMVRSDVSVALLWQPQDAGGDSLPEGLFSDTRKPGGGQPMPFYAGYKAIHEHFGPGVKLLAAASSSPDMEALASARKTLLINKSTQPTSVKLNGRALTLGRYEVRLVDTP